jgi:ectoine hydroxylase-related dioxygenase (phytanoyl-CoA dioxygenase family)
MVEESVMSAVETPAIAGAIREVTDEEVAFYRENGWVKLERLIEPALAEELLRRIQARMGTSAERTRDSRGTALKSKELDALWQYYEHLSEEDEFVEELSHSRELGRVANRLLGDRGVRFYSDEVMCKLPAATGGSKTPWHQDFPYHPFDRRGVCTFWFPLVDCPPEKGTMRFLSGSHDSGPWGRFVHRTDGVDLLDAFPELRERFELSPPLHLRPGDATVHDRNTIHSAPPNATDEPRWVYSQGYFPADALYTGAPNRRMDGLGLKVNEPFDNPKFPLIDLR